MQTIIKTGYRGALLMAMIMALMLSFSCGDITPQEERELEAMKEFDQGMLEFDRMQYTSARGSFKRALDLDPNSTDAQNALSWVEQLLGVAPETEVAEAGEAVLSGDSIGEAGYTLGINEQMEYLTEINVDLARMADEGDFYGCIDLIEEAMDYLGEDSPFYYNMERARLNNLYAAGEYGEFLDSTFDYIGAHGQDQALMFQATFASDVAGNAEDTTYFAETAYEMDPNNHLAKNNMAYTWAENGENLDEALRLAEEALAEAPDNAAYLDTMGWALYKAGYVDQALPYLESSLDRVESQLERDIIEQHYRDALDALVE